MKMYFLERACSMQVRTLSGVSVAQTYPTAPEVIAKNAALMEGSGPADLANQLVWPALIRKLQRHSPGFAD